MSLQRHSFSFIALFLAVGLSTGVLVHAAFPHEHGESSGGVASIWQALHAALRHEDKKTFFAAADALPLSFSGIDVSIALELLIAVFLILYAKRKPVDAMLRALRRGIVPYRKFG